MNILCALLCARLRLVCVRFSYPLVNRHRHIWCCPMIKSGRPSRSVSLPLRHGLMLTLYHHPFCPHSRFIRLALGELGIAPRLVEERVWERREEFLALNPEGTTPVLIE